jgi:hypothetical protein
LPCRKIIVKNVGTLPFSVADPDPYVFGPPGSGSFYNQAKRVRKTLIPTENVASKSNKQKFRNFVCHLVDH